MQTIATPQKQILRSFVKKDWWVSATVSWAAPTQNTDGSALTNLAGFRIYYGPSATQLYQTIQVANPGANVYVVENLAPGPYYFAVRAYSSAGIESASSNIASKVVQ